MKRIVSLALTLSLCLPAAWAAPEQLPAVDLVSSSAVLMEKETGQLLYEKEAHQRMEPASVTKVMTLLLIMEALDSGDLSINQGYNITRQVRELPEEQRDEAAALAVELEKAKKEIRQCDAEADRRGRIADLFCKAFEKAVLLTPTEENVRIWAECTRMTREEIEDSVKDARELAEVFSTIAGILESLLPGGDGDAG